MESCVRCGSLTGVTRRRAYRVVTSCAKIVLSIFGEEEGSVLLARVLCAGLCVAESVNFQRGFVSGCAKILEASGTKLNLHIRTRLEECVSAASGICHNLEKKSTRSSRLGSQMSKSTTYSRKSYKSIKSQYRQIRQ